MSRGQLMTAANLCRVAVTKQHRQQALFEERLDGKIKTSTNSRSMQCFDFLDLSSFRFIYFPHCIVYYDSHIIWSSQTPRKSAFVGELMRDPAENVS